MTRTAKPQSVRSVIALTMPRQFIYLEAHMSQAFISERRSCLYGYGLSHILYALIIWWIAAEDAIFVRRPENWYRSSRLKMLRRVWTLCSWSISQAHHRGKSRRCWLHIHTVGRQKRLDKLSKQSHKNILRMVMKFAHRKWRRYDSARTFVAEFLQGEGKILTCQEAWYRADVWKTARRLAPVGLLTMANPFTAATQPGSASPWMHFEKAPSGASCGILQINRNSCWQSPRKFPACNLITVKRTWGSAI